MSVSVELVLLLLAAVLFGAFALQSLRIRYMLRELLDRDRRLESADRRDQLTGLTNRRVFQELLEREIAFSRRFKQPLGVAVLDVDDMKLINDGLGISAGDRVLSEIADRLQRRCRESDTLARLSGNKFGLVVAKCESVSDILTAIYRVRDTWKSPVFTEGHELRISCSIGLSLFPDDADTVSELLGHARRALAQAKERGSGSLSVFDEPADRVAHERLVRSQELKRAFEDNEFELHLQPQVSIPEGTLTGAEGLVRWRHPEEGLLTAGRFVPLAEQIGLMPELSTWVLEEICRQNARWLAAGVPVLPISVNVSVRHFQGGDVPQTVARILDESGLHPRLLHLEVTESAALHDIEMMSKQFEQLRQLGVELQLDDFGTGYSSLSYLTRYPLNVLKIDRSFVTDLQSHGERRAIVSATLAMAESLGLGVIAEGVETVEEFECLIELGCRRAQGFLLGRPMSCEKYERLLESGRVEVQGEAA